VVVVNAGDAEAAVELALPDLAGRTLVAEPWRGDEAAAPVGVVADDGRLRLSVPARDGFALRVST
jgi:hypothetical protein